MDLDLVCKLPKCEHFLLTDGLKDSTLGIREHKMVLLRFELCFYLPEPLAVGPLQFLLLVLCKVELFIRVDHFFQTRRRIKLREYLQMKYIRRPTSFP